MVTMKDVAELAGVSHGTVSNVLNGVSGVSVDKIKRVEDAIKKLGYKRNALASNLKTTKAQKSIYVVLPNVSDYAYEEIFESIRSDAEDKGYYVSLFIHDELPYRETEILNRALMFNVDGVLLMTCQPENNDFFEKLALNKLNIVCIQREITSGNFDFVGMDLRYRLTENIKSQLNKGIGRIAMLTGPKSYTYDATCIDAYFNGMFNADKEIRNQYVMVTDGDKESAMRAAIKLLNTAERPEVIYVSGDTLANGVKKAIELTSMPGVQNPRIITLNNRRWTLLQNKGEENIILPFGEIGSTAVQLLLDSIEKNGSAKKKIRIMIDAGKDTVMPISVKSFVKETSGKLRILLHNDHAGKAVAALSNDFKKRTGLELEIDVLSHRNVFSELKANNETGKYDVFAIDIPWIKELVLEDYLEPLDKYILSDWQLKDRFQQDIFEEYAMYDDRIHVLPFSFTSQLLFYRKDLFEKLKNKRLFYDWYKEDLKVPRTWEEYNKVSKFFTQQFNPDSDVLYGTTLGGRKFTGSTSEFLLRAWAYGGDIFKGDKIVINSEACINALKNYIECFDFAHPDSPTRWWDDEAMDFCHGSSAMMVQYSDQVTILRDANISTVVGKTGFDMVPGGVSLLGGWSIGMSRNSKLKEEAFEFIKWTISDDMSMPNAVLGRMIPYTSIRNSYELLALYPWHKDTFKTFTSAKKRTIPKNSSSGCISEQILEEILGSAVNDAILRKCTAEEAIETIEKRLTEVLK